MITHAHLPTPPHVTAHSCVPLTRLSQLYLPDARIMTWPLRCLHGRLLALCPERVSNLRVEVPPSLISQQDVQDLPAGRRDLFAIFLSANVSLWNAPWNVVQDALIYG